jgi:hypothetical protein
LHPPRTHPLMDNLIQFQLLKLATTGLKNLPRNRRASSLNSVRRMQAKREVKMMTQMIQ